MAAKTKIKLPTLQELADAGVHYGHRTRRWHPKMDEFIYDSREGIHIIDLPKTLDRLERAATFLQEQTKNGAQVLIVGTKRQAAETVEKLAQDNGIRHITVRWPGGLLTNFDNIKKTIRRYEELADQLKSKTRLDELSTRDKYRLIKEKDRLHKIVGGLVGMEKRPDLIIVIDPRREKTAVAEARKTHTPTIGIIDTNGDPGEVDYPIPGNDDALKSIEVLLGTLISAIKQPDTKAELSDKE